MTCGPAAVQRRTRSYVTPGSSCVGLPAAAGVRINARRTTARSLRDIRPRSRVAETAVFLLLAGLFFTTGGTAATPHHNRPVPILMYHVIADAPAGAAFPELFVTPADFAGQMHWLARHGYHAVTLKHVHDYWLEGTPLPERPIVISFDDGYLGQDTHALPVLRKLGWPGVLNLKVDALKSRYALAPWRVRQMLAAGWELD